MGMLAGLGGLGGMLGGGGGSVGEIVAKLVKEYAAKYLAEKGISPSLSLMGAWTQKLQGLDIGRLKEFTGNHDALGKFLES